MSHRVFNQKSKIIEGWYWALRSNDLKRGEARAVRFFNHELAIFRTNNGEVAALDAFCPHMGAHLAEGRVEGETLRCLFHYWSFDRHGTCVDIPCLPKQHGIKVKAHSWSICEQYGLIWLWIGEGIPKHAVPHVPELHDQPIDTWLGGSFFKNCHPHVVMINAIDAQHFASVHNLPVKLNMEPRLFHDQCIIFANTTRVPERNCFLRWIGSFYKGPLTYRLSYWYGSNGTVTLGPDFLHFHIMFALRPTENGGTEGQTILITKQRKGFWGWCLSRLALILTFLVGRYFAGGDTKIFRSINFNLATPIAPDQAIMRFIKHVESQSTIDWQGKGASA